ncbi:MAG: CBS domain-containing protein [Deltaproteobacteria bacterium]|nr:CBS domain-containing protein [Deltaproteobacteria bacterium]
MYEFVYYKVRDVMTSDPITVGQHVTLAEAEKIFEEHDFNGLPVVDEENRLIGMVTKLDLMKAFAFIKRIKVPHYDTIMSQPISQMMETKPQVFTPETPLTRVLHEMIETGHKSFPVVDDDRVVGIVAREDVLKALRKASTGQLPDRPLLSESQGISESTKL